MICALCSITVLKLPWIIMMGLFDETVARWSLLWSYIVGLIVFSSDSLLLLWSLFRCQCESCDFPDE